MINLDSSMVRFKEHLLSNVVLEYISSDVKFHLRMKNAQLQCNV